MLADQSQPIPLVGAALSQAAADYAARLRLLRQRVPVVALASAITAPPLTHRISP